jgi:hypothetical protein
MGNTELTHKGEKDNCESSRLETLPALEMRRLAWLVEWKFTTSWSAYFLLDKVFHMEIPIAWLSCNAYHIKKIIDGGPGWRVVKNILN